jgi:hypothetical protein
MAEPQRLSEILPDVMQDIRRRMELNRQEKILSAVGDYLSGKKNKRIRRRHRAPETLKLRAEGE